MTQLPSNSPGPSESEPGGDEYARRLRRLMPFSGTSPIFRLMPGEIFFDPAPHRLMTLLGSCVAVCLWDSQRRMGGMTHSLVPTSGRPADEGGALATDAAIVELIGRMIEAGCHPAFMQAKLFGGFNALKVKGRENLIGAANITSAIDTLEEQRITVVAREILGEGGMIIYQNTETGEVAGRRIEPRLPLVETEG